ncbi:hypothetical protein BGX29_002923 [Mortierella sp. GBA35]|nr:hypothetical protein BGX29_002923 [Mortierella sp. GBA35]
MQGESLYVEGVLNKKIPEDLAAWTEHPALNFHICDQFCSKQVLHKDATKPLRCHDYQKNPDVPFLTLRVHLSRKPTSAGFHIFGPVFFRRPNFTDSTATSARKVFDRNCDRLTIEPRNSRHSASFSCYSTQ